MTTTHNKKAKPASRQNASIDLTAFRFGSKIDRPVHEFVEKKGVVVDLIGAGKKKGGR